MYSIRYERQTIEFTVLRKPKMKNIYIQITAEGVLVKTNKSTSLREINALVHKKSAWIVKHLEKIEAKKIEKEIVSGSELYYLGKSYTVEIKEDEALSSPKLEFTHSKFLISAKKTVNQEELAWAVDMFYKQQAIEKIPSLLKLWSKKMGLVPTHVGYRKAKTRWGSCSSADRISFNYYLLKMPISLVEYVVVHELAHIEQKNHSAAFWALVKKYLDDYKLREEQIKRFEKII